MTTSGSLSTNGLPVDPPPVPDSSLLMRCPLDVISVPRFPSDPLLSEGATQSERGRPLLDLVPDEIREVGGAALFRRHHIEAEILELAAYRRIVHHFGKRGIELADDLGRGSLRQEDRVPRIDIEV